MEKEDDEVIASKEAAKILHISKPVFMKMLKNGELPIHIIKVGKYPKFIKKEVEDYWKSRIFKPASKKEPAGE